jgi:alkanesulfonate monooxygenase
MSIEFTFVPQPVTDGGDGKVQLSDRDHAAALQATRAGFENVVLEGLGRLPRGGSLPDSPATLVVPHRATGSPLAAARRLRDLWQRSHGRIALQISGGEDADGHIQSLQRIDEYLTLLKRLWSSERPFDYEGPFYSLRGGFVPAVAEAVGRIPIRMSGLSGTALKVAARHADVLELAAANLEDARFLMERVRAAAAQHGRSNRIRFALPIAIGDRVTANGRLSINPSVQSALELLAYAEAGVSEFTVTADSDRDLQLFGATVATLVRNSAARREPAQSVVAGTMTWNRAFRWQ